jgi:hypothetical protein
MRGAGQAWRTRQNAEQSQSAAGVARLVMEKGETRDCRAKPISAENRRSRGPTNGRRPGSAAGSRLDLVKEPRRQARETAYEVIDNLESQEQKRYIAHFCVGVRFRGHRALPASLHRFSSLRQAQDEDLLEGPAPPYFPSRRQASMRTPSTRASARTAGSSGTWVTPETT